jgi:glycine hydroxymethyltransferase
MELLQFGKSYAQAVIKNSQALAKALVENDVLVRGESNGYSKSHQVLLGYDKAKSGFIARRLEESNIIIDNLCRIGTNEVTRMGMGPAQMEEIAEIMGLVIHGKKPSDVVKKRTKSLIKDFKTPKFVLKAAAEADGNAKL